ncbi:GUCD1 isoform X2 [Brachionus plicatilis]|uniref:GUCD1 isoform X2 n=1 Tax=Brachionus plicatilis TaxID=10195 RepID=A0A3M7R075_BRAPC|nr:GUCD1 isoform X2 [Brachionus plicatilis]
MSHVLEKITTENTERSRVFFFNNDIKHLKQLTQNDCGPACLKMAINFIHRNCPHALRNERVSNIDHLLRHLNLDSKSLWTIDIAHLCAMEKINHVMYTITLGVLDSYSSVDFYSNETNFRSEMLRIEQKFSKAKEIGINVIKDSIDLDRIKYELNRNNVCIVLVDANLLNGKNIHLEDEDKDLNEVYNSEDMKDFHRVSRASCCINPFGKKTDKNSKTDLNKMVEMNIKKSSRSSYCGHYITLVGYDDVKELIFYRNPSSVQNFSFTSYLNFEIARKSFGTDQDILFIYQSFI